MRLLHVVALPHVRLGTDTTHLCAYSGKVEKFIRMMRGECNLLVYAPESEIPGTVVVECLSDTQRQDTFGKDNPHQTPRWPGDKESSIFNHRVIAALRKTATRDDLILLVGGRTHGPIPHALPGLQFCEPFVGYQGILGGNIFAAYESYFHMAQVYQFHGFHDIRWFDAMIPPFVDQDEFPTLNKGDGDYLLFIGRLIKRKGPDIALEIARRAGMKLVVAGAGGRMEGDELVGEDGLARLKGDFEFVGPVGVKERARLMAGAKAVIAPTIYAEPGGNVAIEAMMAGTPVIAPDWGVFSETVSDGVSGFHFRLPRDGVKAVMRCSELSPSSIREYAIERYSLPVIKEKYTTWFDRLSTLWGDGWDSL